MLAPLNLLDQLQARLGESLDSVALDSSDGFLSLVLELPVAPSLPPELSEPCFGLLHSRRGELRAGYGIAAEWQASGPSRLANLRAHARHLAANWRIWDPDQTGFSGFCLLGFAADPIAPPIAVGGPRPDAELPNALLWMPELALVSRDGQAALVLTTRLPAQRRALKARWQEWIERVVPALSVTLPEPLTPAHLEPYGGSPGLGDWRALVESTLEQIRVGHLEKAVLSRRIGLRGRREFDLPRLQATLAWLFPACQVVRIARGNTSFVAATPERLLRVRNTRVEVDAIAGTTARSASAAHDTILTAQLLDSEKDRREHALVVEAVRTALADCRTDLRVPRTPEVMQLHNAQHLWSPISARTSAETDLLDLAERLHPTPATNGEPRRAARDWLRLSEPVGRGWYTGAAGVLEPDLSGELWVLLRCAEVEGNEARLYAGAGIVAGSDPLAEWRETGHKLSAMATALRFA